MTEAMAGQDNANGEEQDVTSEGKERLSSRMRELLQSITVEERRNEHDEEPSSSEHRRRTDRTDEPEARDK
jgi:hypothetical protein